LPWVPFGRPENLFERVTILIGRSVCKDERSVSRAARLSHVVPGPPERADHRDPDHRLWEPNRQEQSFARFVNVGCKPD